VTEDGEEAARVWGVKDEKCVGHFVYRTLAGEFTIAEDDRDSVPVYVVSQVHGTWLASLREVLPGEMKSWRAARGYS